MILGEKNLSRFADLNFIMIRLQFKQQRGQKICLCGVDRIIIDLVQNFV